MSAEHEVEEIEYTEPDNTNVGLITTITLVGTFLVIAIAGALTALVRTEAASYSDEVGAYANLGEVKRLKIEQERKLTGDYAWVDESQKKLVALPIDRAKDLVLSDIQRNPAHATPTKPGSDVDGGADTDDGGVPGEADAGTTSSETGEVSPEQTPTGEAPPAPAPEAPAVPPSAPDETPAIQPVKGEKPKAPKGASPTPSNPKVPPGGSGPSLAPSPKRAPPTGAVPAPAPAPAAPVPGPQN